ncbi:MAG: hypothetical protein FJ100_14515 [Deltaproteobacteria bacterium]|nr:hypothetical protein [Deltaproteobacteria bacterium]
MDGHRALRLTLAAYTACYTGFFFAVLWAEPQVYALLDSIAGLVGVGHAVGAPPPVALWKYVALGLISVLALMSLWAWRDPERGRPLLHLMVYAKVLSGALMVGHFALAGGHAAFLLGGLSDWAMGAGVLGPLAMAYPGTMGALLRLRMP